MRRLAGRLIVVEGIDQAGKQTVCERLVERLRADGVLAYDLTGGYAGFALRGEQVMRRLTDLDLARLPAAGPFARVQALVLRDEGDRYRVYVPQELGHDVVGAVLDAIEGLAE